MSGLLSKMDRTCRYGHGTMRLEPGSFALTGLKRSQYPSMTQAAGLTAVPNNAFFEVRIFVCSHCGYVELADEG